MDSTAWYHANSGLLVLVSNQVHEMELVRRKIYELEQAQIQIKQKLVYQCRLYCVLGIDKS
jgi:hypothetical protein